MLKKVIIMLFVIMVSVMACGCDMSNPLNIHETTTVTTSVTDHTGTHTTVYEYYDNVLISKDVKS